MKRAFTLCFLFVAIVLTSCSDPVNFEGGNLELSAIRNDDVPYLPPVPDKQSAEASAIKDFDADDTQAITNRKIIKDARIQINIKDIDGTKSIVDSLVKKHKGYYSNESYTNTDFEHSCFLEIKVPADNLDLLLNDIETAIGNVYNKEVKARDVTEEYIDLETRLKTRQQYLQQYNALLKKANSIEDILNIQNRTKEIEEEIESATGRLKFLTHQVNYSTLNIQLTTRDEVYNYPDQGPFLFRFKHALITGWRGLVTFTIIIFKTWPFWIIIIAGVYFLRRNIKRKQKNQWKN